MEFIARLKAALLACISEIIKSEPVEGAASLSDDGSGREADAAGGRQCGARRSGWKRRTGNIQRTASPVSVGSRRRMCDDGTGVSLTLLGRVAYRRAYYVCPHCHTGQYPLDRRLGIRPGQMSEEVVKVAALLGRGRCLWQQPRSPVANDACWNCRPIPSGTPVTRLGNRSKPAKRPRWPKART